MRHVLQFPLEAIVWVVALVALALADPGSDSHFTLCPLALAGMEWCPGCGLGRAITLFFHGQVLASLQMHPFGIFAVLVLLFRIFNLSKTFLTRSHGKSN